MICAKYDITPSGALLKLDDIKLKVKNIYIAHDKQKLDSINNQLALHYGKEEQLYKTLCKHYKIPLERLDVESPRATLIIEKEESGNDENESKDDYSSKSMNAIL
eukprot:UN23199